MQIGKVESCGVGDESKDAEQRDAARGRILQALPNSVAIVAGIVTEDPITKEKQIAIVVQGDAMAIDKSMECLCDAAGRVMAAAMSAQIVGLEGAQDMLSASLVAAGGELPPRKQ